MTLRPDFDRVAGAYRWAEYAALGPLLQQTRCHWLPRLKQARHALLLGDGDGRFLQRLLAQNTELTAVAVDGSERMLQLLSSRCSAFRQRVCLQQKDVSEVHVEPGTDVVVTHFFLDCLTQPELDRLARRVADETDEGTLWLVSDFAIPSTPVLHVLARVYVRSLYFAFRVLTGLRVTSLPDVEGALQHAGFARLERHEKLSGLLYTELWQRK
jgi:SAM-dependent methyltransferase